MSKPIQEKLVKKHRKMLKNFALGRTKKAFKQRLDLIKLSLKLRKRKTK